MMCDHLSEEIRKTQKFSTESAFKMFKYGQPIKNQLFDPSKEITLVNHQQKMLSLKDLIVFNILFV